MAIKPLVGYSVVFPSELMPPPYGALYNYLFAGNGVFIQASRPGVDVVVPVAELEDATVRGLASIEPAVTFSHPRVPAVYLQKMLDLSRSACVDNGSPIEALFHLIWLEEERRWRLDKPEQQASASAVRPVDDAAGSSYDLALIEVHSHHTMNAFFSGQDDADEQGFRIYGVLGEIFTDPKILVRVGCFGYFHEVPADQVFELSEGIQDGYCDENQSNEKG